LLAGRIAHQIAGQEQMTKEPARDCRLRQRQFFTKFSYAPEIVQDRPGDHKVAVQWWQQLRVAGCVFFHEQQAGVCYRQRVLHQATREGIELAQRRRQPLPRFGMAVEQAENEPSQGRAGNLSLGQLSQLREKSGRIIARVLDQVRQVEAVSAVIRCGGPDVV
jgi:hypothetical protein